MIRAVVFDFDGLIVDTETPGYLAFRQVYAGYGVELAEEKYALCVGTSHAAFDPYAHLGECLGRPVVREEIEGKFRPVYRAMLEQAELRPGVRSYLEEAQSLGLGIGLASSSTIDWIEPYLVKFGLSRYFDSLCTADNVTKVKPDPELYVQSLDNLGVKPDEAVAFEDSLNGFLAAKAAGLRTVIVPNDLTRSYPFEQYDRRIGSMADVPLAELLRGLQGGSGKRTPG